MCYIFVTFAPCWPIVVRVLFVFSLFINSYISVSWIFKVQFFGYFFHLYYNWHVWCRSNYVVIRFVVNHNEYMGMTYCLGLRSRHFQWVRLSSLIPVHCTGFFMPMDGRYCARSQEGGALMPMDGRYCVRSQEGGALMPMDGWIDTFSSVTTPALSCCLQSMPVYIAW